MVVSKVNVMMYQVNTVAFDEDIAVYKVNAAVFEVDYRCVVLGQRRTIVHFKSEKPNFCLVSCCNY